MKLYVATDHAGFALKESLLAFLRDELGHEVIDCGASSYSGEDDFPDFIAKAAQAVSQNPTTRKAIIFGASGQGEAMMANRFRSVRAAVYYGSAIEIIKLSREHNDANVLSIGARFVSEADAKQVIALWLQTEPLAEQKYQRRITKMDSPELLA